MHQKAALEKIRIESASPFLPHPLETEVAHMHGEPLCKAARDVDVETFSKVRVQLANGFANGGADCWRRQLTQLGD